MGRIIRWTVSLVIVLAVLSSGAQSVPVSMLICCVVFAMGGFFFIADREGAVRGIAAAKAVLVPAFLFLGLVAFQLVPLPPAVLALISPSTYALYGGVGVASAGESWRTIAINPFATGALLLLAVGYLGLFLGVLWYPTEGETDRAGLDLVRGIFWLIFGLAIFNALFFWVQMATGMESRWFGALPKEEARDAFLGTFWNENHFAQFLEMAVPLGLALIFAAHVRWLPKDAGAKRRSASQVNQLFPVTTVLGFAVVLVISALLFSMSRGGMVTLPIAMAFLLVFILLSWRLYDRRTLILYGAVLVATVGFGVWLGIDPVVNEFMTLLGGDIRSVTYGDALKVIRDYPFFGVGLDGWEHIFLGYDSIINAEHKRAIAYNDSLQIIAETGFLGFACLLVGGVVLFKKAISALRRDTDPERRVLIVGGLTALSAALIHAQVDYLFYVPSNAILFTAIGASVYRLSGEMERIG